MLKSICKKVHLIFLLICSALTACASLPDIQVEEYPQTDFSSYHTFGIYSPFALETKGYKTPLSAFIRQQLINAMQVRGYTYQEEHPDLWVNLNATLTEKQEFYQQPFSGFYDYYDYRWGGYYVMPGWQNSIDIYTYKEGVLNIDLIDRKKNLLVWEGIHTSINPDLTKANRNLTIQNAIQDIFSYYPHRGDNTSMNSSQSIPTVKPN